MSPVSHVLFETASTPSNVLIKYKLLHQHHKLSMPLLETFLSVDALCLSPFLSTFQVTWSNLDEITRKVFNCKHKKPIFGIEVKKTKAIGNRGLRK